MKKMNKPRVLIYDIETLFNEGYFFSLYGDQGINHNFIKKEKSILTIAYKWWGDKKTHVIKISDYPSYKKDTHDDKEVVKAFSKVLAEADYIVAHYGDKFDIKFIASRAMINGLEPIPNVPSIDTYKLVKKHFNLNANRLDYLGKLMGFGGKMKMDWGYWARCAEGDVKAVEKMAAYNKQDVDLLESVFDKLLPYVQHKINMNLFNKHSATCDCSSCGSDNTQKRGYWVTKVAKKQRYQCQDCGSWFAGETVERSR